MTPNEIKVTIAFVINRINQFFLLDFRLGIHFNSTAKKVLFNEIQRIDQLECKFIRLKIIVGG